MGFGSGGGFKPGAGDIKGNLTVTGNVGVGTTSPETSLHVQNGSAGTIAAIDGALLILESNEKPKIQFQSPNAYGGSIIFGSPDDSDEGQIDYDNSSERFLFKTGGNTKMAILGDNVGIGTTTFDGTAAGVLAIKNGTSPAALTADQIYIGSKDSAGTGTDGLATLELFTEEAIDATALDAVGTLSHRIPIWLNGTCYWMYLDPV
jgi:hypothetical protein